MKKNLLKTTLKKGVLLLVGFTMIFNLPAQTLVKDINPGAGNASINEVVKMGGNLYFSPDDQNTGKELWKSDGTSAGTVMVKDISSGMIGSTPNSGAPSSITKLNNTTILFAAHTTATGWELWKSDGTASGTVMVKDINPGGISSLDGNLEIFSFNGKAYFPAKNGVNGNELWETDGTQAGTKMIKDIHPGANGSTSIGTKYLFKEVNGTLFFIANDATNGTELWKTDGTTAGTVLVKDINTGTSSSFPLEFCNSNGTLFFRADDGINGTELWKSDGTASGTVMVKDIKTGSLGSTPSEMTYLNGSTYFGAIGDFDGFELWKTDGTATGTVLVKDIYVGSSSTSIAHMIEYNNKLYFRGEDSLTGIELWVSDGTTVGTMLVKDIYEGSTSGWLGGTTVNSGNPENFKILNGRMYFSAQDSAHGYELWSTDGTTNGTLLVGDLYVGTTDGFKMEENNIASLNGLIYAPGNTSSYGIGELYSFTPPTTTPPPSVCIPDSTVTTFAGSGTSGNTNGTGTAASFNNPSGSAFDDLGNLYISDLGSHSIRKITPAGVVTTFAGSGSSGSANGTGTAASFANPTSIAIDGSNNLFITDKINHLIRKITPAGVVTTFAGSGNAGSANGTGTAASFDSPHGIAIDASDNVYITDQFNHLIRKITPTGIVTTLAGSGSAGSANGSGSAASFNYPNGLEVNSSGTVYVADGDNYLIRKITPAGVVTTLAGSGSVGSANGSGTAASFRSPFDLDVDAIGNIYLADAFNNLIRKITPTGVVTTLAGSGSTGSINGTGTTASFSTPFSCALDASGDLFIVDYGNNLIRKITLCNSGTPEIVLNGNQMDITDGSIAVSFTDSTNFGESTVAKTVTYKIKNTGADTLKLTAPLVSITGANAAEFTVSTMPSATILAGDSSTFVVTYNATTTGVQNAMIEIISNDTDEDTFTFAIQAEKGASCGKVYVSKTGNNSNDGRSWANALKDVQNAMDLACANDTIWIAKGTYLPTEKPDGVGGTDNRDLSLHTDKNVVIIGGFAGTETMLSQRDWKTNPTVFDGDLGGSDSSYNIMKLESDTVIIDGIIVQNGAATGSGGVSYSSATFERDHGGAIYLTNAKLTLNNTIFQYNSATKGGGAIILKSSSNIAITNSVFDNNTGQFGGAIRLNSPDGVNKITNVVFSNNTAYEYDGGAINVYDGTVNLTNSTLVNNSSVTGGALLAWSANYTINNTIFEGNKVGGSATAAKADIASFSGSTFNITYSSMQLASVDYKSADNNELTTSFNNIYMQNPSFYSITDLDGTDNIWMTTDDGLRLNQTSPANNTGSNAAVPTGITKDIVGNDRIQGSAVNMGAYEDTAIAVLCKLSSDIPNVAGTYTSTQTSKDGAWDCYCDANNKLLLALDTTGSGAVISQDSVKLFVGANPVVKFTNAGGIITNADGGIIMNRKWEVAPTTQPTSPVKVQFFFTNDEFTAVKDSLATVGTTITSPTGLQIYKLNQNGFLSPHAASASGSLLNSGAIPSTTEWFHTALSANHSATFMVNSFSGGGGGAGANNAALPVDMLSFTAYPIAAKTAQLDWTTASEHNNFHFVIERSFNGISWLKVGTVAGKGNSNAVQAYNFTDANVNASFAYYRIKQVDFNGEIAYTAVKKVNFAAAPQLGSVYPNPVQNTLNISIAQELINPVDVIIYNNMGAKVASQSSMKQAITIDMQSLANGLYTVSINNGNTTQVVKVVKTN